MRLLAFCKRLMNVKLKGGVSGEWHGNDGIGRSNTEDACNIW